eukprot:CAMPEP_0172818492 /NCGR_PEP_ID=MMETSP1075-20121228/13964_1 /TAXON_ID=2916 /ORGANISM="Ceratium fusus, Strain PA161109" /LENGTH=199 /DNA_ID=CAMNT_0013658863 /DNA_START=25 /DNA_END=625 /DNA_ORIENTATION=-
MTYDSSDATKLKVNAVPTLSKALGPSALSMFCKDPFVADRLVDPKPLQPTASGLYPAACGSFCSFASHEDLGLWKLAQAAEAFSEVQTHSLHGNLEFVRKAAPMTTPHALMVCCTCMSSCSEVSLRGVPAATEVQPQAVSGKHVKFAPHHTEVLLTDNIPKKAASSATGSLQTAAIAKTPRDLNPDASVSLCGCSDADH